MKVRNVLGNDYTGTIGDAVTASHWKGRNYLKKYVIPANPQSVQQTRTRDFWRAAVAAWQALVANAKGAYGHKARYDKKQITSFNTMVKSYMDLLLAGLAYVAPTVGYKGMRDLTTGNPIQGGLIIIRRTGQSTEYARYYTPANGQADGGICAEDENYDMIFSADGYITKVFTDMLATKIFDDKTTDMTPVP